MTIDSMTKGGTLGVVLTGVLDYDSAGELQEFFDKNISDVNKLIIDMKRMDFLSSEGMRVLLRAELLMKKKDGMILKHVNEEIMGAIKMAGFDRFLNIQN